MPDKHGALDKDERDRVMAGVLPPGRACIFFRIIPCCFFQPLDKIDIVDDKPPKASRRSTAKNQYYLPVHKPRQVSVYHVSEQELRAIANGNTVSRWAIPSAFSSLSFGAATLVGLLIESSPTEFSKTLTGYIVGGCIAIALVFFGIWWRTKDAQDCDMKAILESPQEEAEL